LAGLKEKLDFPKEFQGTPTSLDSMSPRNPVQLTLADIPLAPGVKGHSIVAAEGDGDYHHGKDGLVAYESAHVDYVESEFIVRGPHSCQSMPPTIKEVRRILHEHLSSLPKSHSPKAQSPADHRPSPNRARSFSSSSSSSKTGWGVGVLESWSGVPGWVSESPRGPVTQLEFGGASVLASRRSTFTWKAAARQEPRPTITPQESNWATGPYGDCCDYRESHGRDARFRLPGGHL